MDNFVTYLKKNKASLIIAIVIWLFAIIFLIAPLSYSIYNSIINGVFNLEAFFQNFIPDIAALWRITKVFNPEIIGIFFRWSVFFTFFYIICVAIGMWKARSKGEYDSIEHGSSDWCQGGEQYRILSKNSGLILAENHRLPLDKIGNINVLIVGGSGSGKSASYSIPNAHQGLGSYIFTDPKGEIYDATAGYLKQQGYDIKIFNLVNPESSDSYNPLFHVKSQLDVDIIASTIVKGQKNEKSSTADPYWDNMSELLLKALIYYLIATRPPEEQNLASCAELVRAANNNGDSNLLSDLINKLPREHPARTNFKNVELASEKTYSSILSSLQSSLGKFDSKEIAEVTSTNTIDFEDIVTKKTALYVVSSDTHAAYDFLLTIFFSQMIQQLYDFADKNGGRLPIQTFFILDEFANIGQIPDFDKKISTSRSRGISFSVILQNLDQLKSIYDKSYETIIGNCDTHVFLGSNSYETVEYFSKELGEKTISHNSKSVNRDNHAVRQGFSESDQIMARALMTPDELRRMDNNDCIIFEKGLKPIKAKKFWWFKKNNISKDLNENRINHNDYTADNKGEWRKFNPYNPYEERKADSKELDITPLDDLFSDIENGNKSTINNNSQNSVPQNNNLVNNVMGTTTTDKKENIKKDNMFQDASLNNKESNINTNSQEPNNIAQNNNAQINNIQPIMNTGIQPMANNNIQPNTNVQTNANTTNNMSSGNINNYQDELDIEKELEAKFDELFGSLDNK